MGTPYLSEIRIFSFNFAPKGWAMCNGQFLPINQNQALFSLLGTMYGGNGQTTFALPDLRGKLPLHVGSTQASGGVNDPLGKVLGGGNNVYHQPQQNFTTLRPDTVTNVGGSQP